MRSSAGSTLPKRSASGSTRSAPSRPSTTCRTHRSDSTGRSTSIGDARMPADYRYCFARRTHPYLDFNAGDDFDREIVVKVNAPERLRAELAKPSWGRDLVAIGTNTDPYQWVESRYRMMPEVLEALRDSGTPVSVLTKSPLALRDIELYKQMAAGPGASVSFSVPTLDEKVWRQTEPHTPNPRARLEA